MNRKRNAPADVAPSKKRKTDVMPKFYAVRAGHEPGVYTTYAECQQQTAGFKGAIFKSFTSMEDAQAFAAGKKVAGSAGEPDRFYAVAVGSPTGIFTDWADASAAITGVKGPKYKRFATREEAVAYIKQHGSQEAIEALGETVEHGLEPIPLKSARSSSRVAAGAAKTAAVSSDEDVLRIWTDGSSLMNGKSGARAGVGVFFGDHDARNLAEPLQGLPQTNQRAELMAVKRALEIAPTKQTVEIWTDSKYAIGCMTQWSYEWEKKGWKTSNNGDVKNLDILRPSLDLVRQRSRAGANTYFKWVKGHSFDRGNNAADQLAVKGAKMDNK
ncbi:hypothetical protein CDD82_5718 [Ophiocordyceps australis]|uniref:Ribonuclease H n=1 Tax=Ophiocordyceps australis TaxID=1399860 RepID=A0A2C5YZF0_9HYPO|nr:hypothetical protein CDD82_5718 [Ophiocordyceps australis]